MQICQCELQIQLKHRPAESIYIYVVIQEVMTCQHNLNKKLILQKDHKVEARFL